MGLGLGLGARARLGVRLVQGTSMESGVERLDPQGNALAETGQLVESCLRVRVRVRAEGISAKTRASSENPLNNSCYLVGILWLNSPTIPVLSKNDDTQRECV